MNDNITPISHEKRLSEIIRQVKVAAAERDDVVVDMKEADRARLELLADDLKPVIDDIPDEVELFDFAISSGPQPRFWIDCVAHVHMGRDRRTYRFVRDTRLGRVIVEETGSLDNVSDAVGRYIAERLVERQRVLDGDMEPVREYYARKDRERQEPDFEDKKETAEPEAEKELPAMTPPAAKRSSPGFTIGLSWFILGSVAGAIALIAAFWDQIVGVVN